jgi:hypothetical protein
VFLPYLTSDAVFDNARAVGAVGHAPAPFPQWAVPLLEWARNHGFEYPYLPWPGEAPPAAAPPSRPERRLAS